MRAVANDVALRSRNISPKKSFYAKGGRATLKHWVPVQPDVIHRHEQKAMRR